MKIQEKVVLVTGGLSGLGEASVKRFSELGATVVVFDLAELKNDPESFQYYRVDVSNEEEVTKAVNEVYLAFGRIDVLINCAGIAPAKKIIDRNNQHLPLSEFSKALNVNVCGSFNVCACVAEKMLQNEPDANTQERGVVINTASIAAFDGQKGQCAYAASKGAIVSLTLPMARDLAGFNIRVMAIAPGVMGTPMMQAMPEKVQVSLEAKIPFPSRMGFAQEYAQLAQQIVENSYLNGEVIRLDGALRMS